MQLADSRPEGKEGSDVGGAGEDEQKEEKAKALLPGSAKYEYMSLTHLAAGKSSPAVARVIQNSPWDEDIISRFADVMPGGFDDPIQVKLYEGRLKKSAPKPRNTLPSSSSAGRPVGPGWLKTTLPGWDAHRSPNGTLIFNKDGKTTSWDHPDTDVTHSRYDDASDENGSNPKYEALSYAWNSDQKTHSIQIINTDTATPRDEPLAGKEAAATESSLTPVPVPAYWSMPVTESLFQALKHIRRTDRPRCLWVDAICINQESDVEKSDQVQHMGDIYRLARRVIVWLGPESHNSKLALSTLEYLGAQVDYDEYLRRWFDPPDAHETGWGRPSFKLPYDDVTWAAIEDLLRRSWFRRLWVVQEIQLAQGSDGAYLLCGRNTISRAAFRRSLICLYFKLATLPDSLHWPIIEAYDLVRPKERLIFHRVLEQIVFNQLCKDDRDKIYGILGVTPRRFAAKTEPDYTESCTAVQVFTTTFVHHAQHVGRLELWGHCSSASRKITDLPFWVPDWSVRSPVRRQLQPQFAASTSRAHLVYDEEIPRVLKVLGIRCAVVNRATDPLPKPLDQASAINHVRQWEPPNINTTIYRPTGETFRRAYVTTLASGDVAEMWPDGGQPTVAQWEKQDSDDALLSTSSLLAGKPTMGPKRKRMPFVYRALDFCRGRAFFETEEGYCGLGPSGIKAGDVVVVFLGCTRPLVLRPSDGNVYKFLGDAYVHGLEGARAMLGPLPQPWQMIGIGYGVGGRDNMRFLNTETGERLVDDPRLSASRIWERVAKVVDGDDPEQCDFFQNKKSGQIISHDPRLEPDELEGRGVKLEWFSLT